MLRLQVCSDLHIDINRDFYFSDFQKLVAISNEVDGLIVAGDICETHNVDRYKDFLDSICTKYKQVFLVFGNHEFYKKDFRLQRPFLVNMIHRTYPNVTVLDNQRVIHDGYVIYGGTGWFPKPSPMDELVKFSMGDFNYIENVEDVYSDNNHFNCRLSVSRPDLVISHHLPLRKSINLRYLQDSKSRSLNAYFLSESEQSLSEMDHSQLQVWVHGHTHDCLDYYHNLASGHEVRVVCNPYGYGNENPNFDFAKVIEVK